MRRPHEPPWDRNPSVRLSRRATVGLVVWGIGLLAFALIADPSYWLAFILGMLFPTSVWLLQAGARPLHERHLDTLLRLTPREFEETVADLFAPLGFRNIQIVGGASDLGVDVIGTDADGNRVAIQCKRYRPDRDIDSAAVQAFMGGMVAHKAERGIIVTTSSFSAPARDLATRQRIRLIDGPELTHLLSRHNRFDDATA